MNTHPKNALKVLQLLLRCGMVGREELNVVLEMMSTLPDSPYGRQGRTRWNGDAARGGGAAPGGGCVATQPENTDP